MKLWRSWVAFFAEEGPEEPRFDPIHLAVVLGLLVWPTLALGWVLSLWNRGIASWERMKELLVAVPTLADPAQPAPHERFLNRNLAE